MENSSNTQGEHQPVMLDHALMYLRAGLPIWPVCSPRPGREGCREHGRTCQHIGKTPLVKWGDFQRTLPTEADVEHWWSTWPLSNIGVATGALAGFVVLDADTDDAVSYCMEMGGLEDAPVHETGKGLHFLFRHPGVLVHNFAGKYRPNVDFRGDGGYVLLAPSLHASGKRYTWQSGEMPDFTQLPPVPDWLMDALVKPTAAPESSGLSWDGEKLDLSVYAEGIGQGARNDMIFKLCASLRAKGTDYEVARMVVLAAAERCHPPLPESEALFTLDRAWARYPAPPPTVNAIARGLEDDDEDVMPEGEGTPTEADEYPIRSLRDMFASLDLDEDKWLVEGILRRAMLTWIYAGPGTGKTLLALFLALHVASGQAVGDREVAQGSVLFFCEDMSIAGSLEYLDQLARGSDIPPDCPFFMNQVQGMRLTSKAERLLAWRKVEEVKPTLVIIDSCERVVPSETFTSKELDEMIQFVRACTSHGIAVAVIDHTTKNREGKRTVDTLYGARAKSAAADVMIQLSGNLQKPSGVRATWTKERGSPTPPHEIHLEATEEGMRFTIASTITKAKTPSEKRIVTYLTSLRGDERTKEEIAKLLKVSEKTAKRALDALVFNGVVKRRNQPQANGSKLAFYCITCAVEDDDPIGFIDNDAA